MANTAQWLPGFAGILVASGITSVMTAGVILLAQQGKPVKQESKAETGKLPKPKSEEATYIPGVKISPSSTIPGESHTVEDHARVPITRAPKGQKGTVTESPVAPTECSPSKRAFVQPIPPQTANASRQGDSSVFDRNVIDSKTTNQSPSKVSTAMFPASNRRPVAESATSNSRYASVQEDSSPQRTNASRYSSGLSSSKSQNVTATSTQSPSRTSTAMFPASVARPIGGPWICHLCMNYTPSLDRCLLCSHARCEYCTEASPSGSATPAIRMSSSIATTLRR